MAAYISFLIPAYIHSHIFQEPSAEVVTRLAISQYCQWLSKDVIFTGLKLKADPEFESSMAVALDRIALLNFTLIYGWNIDGYTYLDDVDDSQLNQCIKVVFATKTILVMRALLPSLQITTPSPPTLLAVSMA
ncbi:uncharacterized protein EV420DRAFT_1487806 [Desarmillaria tabescens]|uniref:Uncharacterized protein n=1 Tax=Armillaria tabescens TaxID=1929756 RepID=A0AA39J5W9_ARMTA|nr:uncharacterized protein EV420DRAFT_1487806 [Desarmillaria tabescens]KAK0435927.1 hypothetical protein EV420DRAFT_1487806 [Desarmillaria tabescens]